MYIASTRRIIWLVIRILDLEHIFRFEHLFYTYLFHCEQTFDPFGEFIFDNLQELIVYIFCLAEKRIVEPWMRKILAPVSH